MRNTNWRWWSASNCRHITPAQAPDYIFGYTICNDVSARDRQRERMKMGQPYAYAKNLATFCPMGPWIVTAKELGDPRNLKMDVRINGKVTRSGNSGDMIFDPFEVLAYCSDYTPMEAGDIIALGTFSGDKKIVAGDLVELDVETHRHSAQPRGAVKRQVVEFRCRRCRPDRWCGRRKVHVMRASVLIQLKRQPDIVLRDHGLRRFRSGNIVEFGQLNLPLER